MTIKDARSLPPAAQEELRRKAVRAVVGGRKQKEAAELFGVTPQAVYAWMKRHRQGGLKALGARKRGRPRSKRLLPWQAAQTVRMIAERCPDRLELPFCLWTRQAVGELIEEKFGANLSVWTVGRHLRSWGFTPQKPLRRAYERNPREVERWLKEEYPPMRRQARRKGGEINWGDEMGLRGDHQAGRSYGRRGQTPAIGATGNRFGCNTISAITNRGRLRFMVFRKGFSADVFIEFLRRLARQTERRVFLIVDRHPVRRSGKVKKWLAKRRKAIRLFLLPAFSPQLNPDEMLNQDVKSNAVGRRRARDGEEPTANVRNCLRRRQRRPHVARRHFQEKHVRYAAV